MKLKIIFSIILSFVFFLSYADLNSIPTSKGGISGTVVDATSQQPIEYATIALYSEKDSTVVNGAIANHLGQFNLNKISHGRYVIEVSFVGYEKRRQIVEISKGKEKVSLGNITLHTTSEVLEEVEVTGERSTIEQKIDRKVINVGKDLTSAGTNALAVLTQIPSVDVNEQEATVSLRGNENVKILVDGKPTHIDPAQLLRQIPSTSIKTIELITNPSAKYNPEGMSGIINITLKKNASLGFNGSINLGYTRGDNNRYNASFDLNYRKGKINWFANVGSNFGKRKNYGNVFRRDNQSDQDFSFKNDYKSFLGKFGFDYYINDNNTFSFYTNQSWGDRDFTGLTVIDFLKLDDDHLDTTQIAIQEFKNYTQVYNGNFKHDFAKEGHNIEFEINFAKTTNDDDSKYTTEKGNLIYQDIVNRTHKNQTYNVDYTNPLTEKTKLELGFESRIRKTDNTYETTSNFLSNSDYTYDRYIHSFYATVGHKLEKIAIQVGARLEIYDVEAIQDNVKVYEDNYVTVYPSAYFTYTLNEKNQFQFSYSRRVDRPGLRQVNPIREWSTPLISSFGNPSLKPQFSNSFELNYICQMKNGSITSGIFFRRINDEITRIINIDPDDENRSILSYDNYDSNNAYGFELSSNYRFTKWWRTNTSFDIYKRTLNGVVGNESVEENEVIWNIRMNNNFIATKKLRFQVYGMYRGGHQNLQFDIDPMWKIDIGARYNIFKEKATISARFNDIFDSFHFGFDTTRPYPQGGEFFWEAQNFYLGFSYNFGSNKTKKRIRKIRDNNKQENPGGGGFL